MARKTDKSTTPTTPDKPVTAKSLVRRTVILDQSATTEAIMGTLTQAGFDQIAKSSVSEWRSETLGVLRVVDELGLSIGPKQATPTPDKPKRVRVRKPKAVVNSEPLPAGV
jgi:hypothetical protein